MVEVSVHERNRAERAIALYNERGDEIRKIGPQTYLVPGCSADQTEPRWRGLPIFR